MLFLQESQQFYIAMAVPPRFPGMIPAYGVQIPQMTPMSKFLKHLYQRVFALLFKTMTIVVNDRF